MAQLRLCTHIKTNGIKCGSPALRHHTLCYFHYQWQKRDQRRVRLGGPIGMNKNSGIELPLLDGPEAILVSIMEIQHALIDKRIEIKMGTALLYSLQLALQAKIPLFGLSSREAVRECPELEMDLEMERAKSLRPAKEKCAACPKQESCLSPRNCKKLPKLPPGYRREGDHLVRDRSELDGDGVVPDTTTDSSSRAKVAICCSRAAVSALATAVEGPAFSPLEATGPDATTISEAGTTSLQECSPGREPGESAPNCPQSRANVRRQIQLGTENRELRTNPTKNEEQGTKNPPSPISYADCILGSNPHALIDLPGKFPQLVENNDSQNQGVGHCDGTTLIAIADAARAVW